MVPLVLPPFRHGLTAEALKQPIDLIALFAPYPRQLEEHRTKLPVVDVVRGVAITFFAVAHDLAHFAKGIDKTGIVG
jgi:hypothetical protein